MRYTIYGGEIRKGVAAMHVRVYAGTTWDYRNQFAVEELVVSSLDQAVEPVAHAIRALASFVDHDEARIMARDVLVLDVDELIGYADPISGEVVAVVPDDARVVDTNSLGDPVFENGRGLWLPFYVSVDLA